MANIGVGLIAVGCAARGSADLVGLRFALQWPLGWLIDRFADRQRRALAQQAQPVALGLDTAAGSGAG